MPKPVSDFASNAPDQIAYAARKIGRSTQRAAVFGAICYGKKKRKTILEVMDHTGLSYRAVLDRAGELNRAHLIETKREDGQTFYYKVPVLCANRNEILSLARNRKKLEEYPTKVRPKPIGSVKIETIEVPQTAVRASLVTVDDMDSFADVRCVDQPTTSSQLSEAAFKAGIQRIIGEEGEFQDWGGEPNDLFTTQVRLGGQRRAAAFAFKGPGTRGKLTIGKMGKNGDQILRLFQAAPAQVFLVQYHDQIDQAVLDLMAQLAKAKSVSDGIEVWYGVIDGRDTSRLIEAYLDAFNTEE